MNKSKERSIFSFIEKALNRLNLREKIIGLFIFCVIIPLITVDGYIINRIVKEEREESVREAENTTLSIENYFSDVITTCHNIATSINQNYNVGEVLGKSYDSTFEYYDNYHRMSENYFFQTLVRFNNMKVKLYTSNDSVVGGGYVGKVSEVVNSDWYKEFKKSESGYLFCCNYDDTPGYKESRRRMFYVGKLQYNNNSYENFIRIDLDYSTVSRDLIRLENMESVYICSGDTVLFSSEGNNNLSSPYSKLELNNKKAFNKEVSNLGNIDSIVVESNNRTTLSYLYDSRYMIAMLILFSLAIPALVLYVINHSIVYRIENLNNVFGKRENDELVKVEFNGGSDEIAHLMSGYNTMVDEVNRLIQIVYKDRLKEQEMSIARQNAELLALHSQINPHFMFNALESIRMHSLIKGETETAEMVQKLALMERQYVNWDSDMIPITQEIASVEAYLLLQKYRFGDRLQYEISIEESCKEEMIPKLTVVTFVENACVHGMENKTSESFVFLRVYQKEDNLIIEVEDTGNGMSEEKLDEIKRKAETINLEDLKNDKHVGIYNALLRLKMTMGAGYKFDIESEEGIGTLIQITIPKKMEEEEEI